MFLLLFLYTLFFYFYAHCVAFTIQHFPLLFSNYIPEHFINNIKKRKQENSYVQKNKM